MPVVAAAGEEEVCVEEEKGQERRSVLQSGIVHLVHVLRNLWSPALQRQRVIGIARLYAELGENPDPVGEFERLVQHVLAFHVPLCDGVDIVALQFARHRICV